MSDLRDSRGGGVPAVTLRRRREEPSWDGSCSRGRRALVAAVVLVPSGPAHAAVDDGLSAYSETDDTWRLVRSPLDGSAKVVLHRRSPPCPPRSSSPDRTTVAVYGEGGACAGGGVGGGGPEPLSGDAVWSHPRWSPRQRAVGAHRPSEVDGAVVERVTVVDADGSGTHRSSPLTPPRRRCGAVVERAGPPTLERPNHGLAARPGPPAPTPSATSGSRSGGVLPSKEPGVVWVSVSPAGTGSSPPAGRRGRGPAPPVTRTSRPPRAC